jgi:translation initiation factor 2 alpha subunit (eIF-2alpha)
MEEQLEEGQIVLGTVDKIVGTTVFVKIEGGKEGTLITSEISPGRIRNLRDYVVPGKKIVCKILHIRGDRIHLSLRRVKQNEKKELLDKVKKEKNSKAILKTVLGKEESEKIIKKITEDQTLVDFFEQAKKEPKILEKYVKKQNADKILKILESKKEKPKEIKHVIKLSSKSPEGIKAVKKIITNACKDSKCNVSYIAAGKYNLGILGEDFKQIKSEIHKVTEDIEKQAKKENCEFSLEKSKH